METRETSTLEGMNETNRALKTLRQLGFCPSTEFSTKDIQERWDCDEDTAYAILKSAVRSSGEEVLRCIEEETAQRNIKEI